MDQHFKHYMNRMVDAERVSNAERAEELAARAAAGELDPDELVELAAELRELANHVRETEDLAAGRGESWEGLVDGWESLRRGDTDWEAERYAELCGHGRNDYPEIVRNDAGEYLGYM